MVERPPRQGGQFHVHLEVQRHAGRFLYVRVRTVVLGVEQRDAQRLREDEQVCVVAERARHAHRVELYARRLRAYGHKRRGVFGEEYRRVLELLVDFPVSFLLR